MFPADPFRLAILSRAHHSRLHVWAWQTASACRTHPSHAWARLLQARKPEPSTSFQIAWLVHAADSFSRASHSVSRTGLNNVVSNSNPSRTSSRALPLPCVSRAADPSMSQRDPLGIVSRTDPFKIVSREDHFSVEVPT